jgi:hypothetical protein
MVRKTGEQMSTKLARVQSGRHGVEKRFPYANPSRFERE